MDEVSNTIQLLESLQASTSQPDYIEQLLEFERFLSEMRISVKKKQILGERDLVMFQKVSLNQ